MNPKSRNEKPRAGLLRDMPRDREHLALPERGQPLARRKRRAVPQEIHRSRPQHGRKLIREVEQAITALQEKRRSYPTGFNPANILCISLHPDRDLTEDMVVTMGLRLLAKEPKRALVVVADDAQFGEIVRRLRSYSGVAAGGPQYGELDVIESIQPLSAGDRMGHRLRAQPLSDTDTVPCDIEVWHTGRRPDCERFLTLIQEVLATHGLRISDRWIGESICVARARLNRAALAQLLEMPEVKEVDRPARPAFEQVELFQASVANWEIAERPAEDLVGIIVLDSGVMQQHPLIAPALGDAQVFPDTLGQRLLDGPADGTQEGHGTGVCGIAAYGDVLTAFRDRRFTPTALLFSGRVTDANNEYDEDILLESQLERAIDYFLTNYPRARVVNLSLGNANAVYAGGYQTRFAAAVDDLAHRYSARGILIVVSAGNLPDHAHTSAEEIRNRYPRYLLDPMARLIDPATSAIAITVGGLSVGPMADRNWDRDAHLPVAGDAGLPSPFTRTGPGVDNAIKPEVVEGAGDWLLMRSHPRQFRPSGVVTTSKHLAQGALLAEQAGTSFAAPKVANIAAQLMRQHPTYSSNLIRALIAHSAVVPANRPQVWQDRKATDADILRVYGYGQPSLERGLAASQNDPWLLVDGEMAADTFRLYELPELPPEFLSQRGKRTIRVTLAFDPPTRPTRKDSYLGFSMEFALYRNLDADVLSDAYRSWDRNEREELEDGVPPGRTELTANQIKLSPSSTTRNGGTLQSAWVNISRANWNYSSGTPLYLAVVCQRKWAPPELLRQRFAVVLSISHENPAVDLHARLRERVPLFLRERVRV